MFEVVVMARVGAGCVLGTPRVEVDSVDTVRVKSSQEQHSLSFLCCCCFRFLFRNYLIDFLKTCAVDDG